MKTGTLDKMKFMVLKNRLQLPRYIVMGLLEGLWYLTATNAPIGDIGRFSDVEIAAWLEWPHDPERLIHELVLAGFLEPSEKHRLIVHDWSEHAPDHVKNNLKRWGKAFAKDDPVEPTKDDPKEPPEDYPPDPVKPDQTKPSSGRGETGVSTKRSGNGKNSVFRNLQGEHLHKCELLIDWFRFATTKAQNPLFAESGAQCEANLLFVFSAAERAIEESDDPLKLFKWIVGKEQRKLITQAQEDRARLRLKRLEQLEREGAM